MRLSAVKRWHMIDTTRNQNLAEHTANVGLLSWTIAHTSPQMFFDPDLTLRSAMVHDLGEAFLGDVPTHSKLLIGKDLLAAAEASVLPAIFQRQAANPDSPEYLLLKLCDLADGIRFIRLHGVDMTADHAQRGLEEQFRVKLFDSGLLWPDNVWKHVHAAVVFYAYEARDPSLTRNRAQTLHPGADDRVVAHDLDRESVDEIRHPRSVLRTRIPPRDGVAGVEGGEG